MSPKTQTNFRIDEEMLAALQRIRERDGIPVSEQVRRALQIWISEKADRQLKEARKHKK
jgi:antitoxin component of RelBE/YafQ-DinJ toxin-antitoxin module